jgi:hypothetical protein
MEKTWIDVKDNTPKNGEIVIGIRNVGNKYIYDISKWNDKYYKFNGYVYWLPLSFLPDIE